MATYTTKLEILEFQSTDTAEASTSATTVVATTHGLSVGDFIVNTTRKTTEAERGSRRVLTVPDANSFTVTSISGQTSGDSFRKYEFVDRTSLLKSQTLRVNLGTQGASSLSFSLITDSTYIPQCGQYIKFGILTDASYKGYFYGIIQSTNRRKLDESTTEIIVDVQAESLNTVPNRRTIQIAYEEADTFQSIVQDMVDDYLVGDGIERGTISAGESLDYDWADDTISISDVLDRCASESGFQWFVDENAQLNFYQDPTSITTNSITIDEDSLGVFSDFRKVTVTSNVDQYLNKYFINGGYDERGNPVLLGTEDFDESDDMQDVCAGTGVYGQVLRDSGIAGSEYVTSESGTNATNITYTAHGQATGDLLWNLTRDVYRTVSAVPTTNTITVASVSGQTAGDIIVFFDKANNIFDNVFKSQGRLPIIVTFESDTLSFNPGERLRIKLPSLGITDEYFLIQNVQIFDKIGTNATTVNAYSCRVTCVIKDNSNFSTQRLKDFRDFWGEF